MKPISLLTPLIAIVCAPLLPGVINRIKSIMAGRQGPPLLQPYFDLFKLARKGTVFSRTTSPVFRTGPIIGTAATVTVLGLVPLGSAPALLSFSGDFILLAYLLGLARFVTVMAALDTGSSFEGIGASREVFFAALAEPALLLALTAVALITGSLSLSEMSLRLTGMDGFLLHPATILIIIALFLVLLAENARIPVDDPNTHLELTMIHEVMILDHSGPDLGLIEYSSALKFFIFSAVISAMLVPSGHGPVLSLAAALTVILLLAVLTGLIEASMARLRITRVPQMMVGAGVLAILALLLQ